MIAVIDYQLNNLKSLTSALSSLDIKFEVISNPESLADFQSVILPGVGAFSAGMNKLVCEGWDKALVQSAQSGTKIMGICLGMQLLFESSKEFEPINGLKILKGTVDSFIPKKFLPVPHMGWNDLRIRIPHQILNNIRDGVDMYFVHSYYVKPINPSIILAETEYGNYFPSIVLNENILGVQFHPEKSYPAGIQLLKNFANWT